MVLHSPASAEPATVAQPHPFVDSGHKHVAPDGRRFALCAACGGVKRWAAHHGGSKAKAGGHRPADYYRKAKARPFTRPDSHEWKQLQPASIPPAREERPTPPVPIAPAPPAPKVHPWQLYALEAALDAAMTKADDLEAVTVQRVVELQRAIRSELHPSTLRRRPEVMPDPDPVPAPATFPTVQPLPTGAGGESRRRIIAGIRNDKLRKLAVRALESAWQPKVLGSGHLRLTSPEGGAIVLSMTSDGGGRAYANAKAQAKRSGLDTAGL